MGDHVTRKQWEAYCRQEREKDFLRKMERDKRDHQRWKAENDKLLNPPPPPPKPKLTPAPPDISDVRFADYQFARGGLVELETKDPDDDDFVERHWAKRKATTKRKGGNLVDTYT